MKKKRANMLQKGMAVLLTAALVTGMASGAASEVRAAEDMMAAGEDWTLDQDGTLTITSQEGMMDWGEEGSEDGRIRVKRVRLADSVTMIPELAFSDCTELTGIEFPDYVGTIGQEAFFGCTGLTQIEFPDYLETIGQGAFLDCTGLTEITIPSMVAGIGDNAFFNCSSLEAVYVRGADDPADLGYQVFHGCRFETEGTKGIFLDSCTQIPDYQRSWRAYSDSITGRHNAMTKTEEVAATCTKDGNREYYTCADCGRRYDDARGSSELTEIKLEALGHSPEQAWQAEEKQHWHVCSRCGAALDASSHIENDGTVTKAPTEKETGIMTYQCRICGYEMRTELIPATGSGEDDDQPGSHTGEISQVKEQGENTPVVDIATSLEVMAALCLTEEEKQQMQDGADVTFVLSIKDAGSSVSEADRAAVESVRQDFILGQYLDLCLYKLTGQNRSAISELPGKITMTIVVPEGLRNTDRHRTRNFAVVRVHNGKAEILSDLGTRGDAITIETDCFSTYAIVYKDKEMADEENEVTVIDINEDDSDDEGEDGEEDDRDDNDKREGGVTHSTGDGRSETGDGVPDTGDHTHLALHATLTMVAGFSYLLLYFADRRKGMTEEKKKELVSRLIRWGRKGGKFRRLLAAAVIVLLLVYYHSIGKKTALEWGEVI